MVRLGTKNGSLCYFFNGILIDLTKNNGDLIIDVTKTNDYLG